MNLTCICTGIIARINSWTYKYMDKFNHQTILAMAVPLFLMLLFFIPSSIAKTSFRPRALALPVTKDQSTSQYVTTFRERTPLVPLKLTVDLGGQFLWVDCDQGYVSSSYKPAHCNTAQCSLANSKACG